MAQRHLDSSDPMAGTPPKRAAPLGAAPIGAAEPGEGAPVPGGIPLGDALAGYLRAQATEFLRALRQHRETGGAANGSQESVDAARALRRSARRISGSLHTFRPLLDADWSESMRPELAWLSGTLAREHAYSARLERLLLALHRLSGSAVPAARPAVAALANGAAGTATGAAPGPRTRAGGQDASPAGPRRPAGGAERGQLTVGAAKAGALLDRQLTLARTRAHSAALQALGSSRFHAVADSVAVLASEVPLTSAAAAAELRPLAAAAGERLCDAVTGLPLVTAGHPYNAEALVHGLSPDTAPQPQDAPWHQVRLLLRLHRYAQEVLCGGDVPVDTQLLTAGRALNLHRDAAEAASAASAAARTPRIAPATAYALGVLHADQRHEVEAARFAFQQSWRKEAVNAS
ncbi:CHAD domain-containing protein [Streptomyces sp. NPDC059785]|uniref:CHAD domain-containing protein n=1 Tax=Streptomyces sp. NPDC059785 TaxID=3346945 RepID=UPI00364AD6D5